MGVKCYCGWLCGMVKSGVAIYFLVLTLTLFAQLRLMFVFSKEKQFICYHNQVQRRPVYELFLELLSIALLGLLVHIF